MSSEVYPLQIALQGSRRSFGGKFDPEDVRPRRRRQEAQAPEALKFKSSPATDSDAFEPETRTIDLF